MTEQERAFALTTDDFLMGVAEKQRQLYIRNILDSADEDVDFRERERLKLRGLEEFIAALQSIAADRKVQEKRWKIF